VNPSFELIVFDPSFELIIFDPIAGLSGRSLALLSCAALIDLTC
jgi:hypothetical protein